jgi:large subunit ribosomal protein L6
MSRVGKLPVNIPEGVKIEVNGNVVSVEGPKGKLTQSFSPVIKIEKDDGKIVVKRPSDEKIALALHGTVRSLIANMVKGVSEGFQKELELIGVGYSANMQGRVLVLKTGFSHPIKYTPPEDINIEVSKGENFLIVIKGADKQKVGEVACKVRNFAPPDSYKGKGIRYKGEHIKLKQGKTGIVGAPGVG